MTTQTAEELDIFNATKPVKAAETPRAQEPQQVKKPSANAIQGDRKKRMVNFVNRIQGWHFLVFAVVLAVLFTMVPKLFSKPHTSAPQQATPVQQPVSVRDVLTAPEPAPQEPLAPVGTAEQSGVTTEQLKALNEQVQSLGGIVVGLQKTLSELEAKVALIESGPAAGGKKVVQQQPVRRQPQASEPSAVAGYSLNTVYSDQAWIRHGEKTFVVQVGDLVDGLKIIGIDPVARRVTTSRGVIR